MADDKGYRKKQRSKNSIVERQVNVQLGGFQNGCGSTRRRYCIDIAAVGEVQEEKNS